MIKEKQALGYTHQLHPAFAGYLHDGFIGKKDVLGIIFYLSHKGYIEFIWENENPNSKIIEIRKKGKSPNNNFDNLIIKLLFTNNNDIKAIDISNVYSEPIIQLSNNLILNNKEFSIDNIKLEPINSDKIYLNNNVVNTREGFYNAYQYHPLIMGVFIIFFLFGSIPLLFSIFTVIAALFNDNFINNWQELLMVATMIAIQLTISIILIGIPGIIMFSYLKGRNIVKKGKLTTVYEYIGNKEIKVQYDNLYQFLSKNPLDERKWDNEFLPFAISYGLNNSWDEEFGIKNDTIIRI